MSSGAGQGGPPGLHASLLAVPCTLSPCNPQLQAIPIPYPLSPIPYSLFPIPSSPYPQPRTNMGAGAQSHAGATSSAYRIWYFTPRKTIVPISGMLIISVCFSPKPQPRSSSVGLANSRSVSA